MSLLLYIVDFTDQLGFTENENATSKESGKKKKHVFDHMANIGIKHVFSCINIYWTPRLVLKPEPERWGF